MTPEKRQQLKHCMKWREKNPARQVRVAPHTYSVLLEEGSVQVKVVGESIEDAEAAMVTVANLL